MKKILFVITTLLLINQDVLPQNSLTDNKQVNGSILTISDPLRERPKQSSLLFVFRDAMENTPVIQPEHDEGISTSGVETMEFDGRTCLFYTASTQTARPPEWSAVRAAFYQGLMKQFLESWFPGGVKMEEVSSNKPKETSQQGMFYKPALPETGSMWDTWVYFHKGNFYLYSTCNSGGNLLDNVSMARSEDGVHWTEIGRVLTRHSDSDWLGTGSTWKSCNYEKDRKFYMDFCERREGGRREQEIYFAESADLIHWKRLDDNNVFKTDQRWYKPGCWTTIWTIPRPGGGLYGYWTCNPKPETGASFGFGETLDGLKWNALTPPKVYGIDYSNNYQVCELGAIEKIGSKYYAMVGVEGRMLTLVADRPDGPFYLSKKNAQLLGVKRTERNKTLQEFTYFSRFCRTPESLLVNHHTIARGAQGGSLNAQVYLGLLKLAVIDKEGTLRLGWWNGNEKLKNGSARLILSGPVRGENTSITMLNEKLDIKKGIIIEGFLELPDLKNEKPAGLFIPWGEDQGSAILVHSAGMCEFGEMNIDGSNWDPVISVNREVDLGYSAGFRLVLKESLLEFYINDLLIECYSMPFSATGKLGLIGKLSEVRVWNCN